MKKTFILVFSIFISCGDDSNNSAVRYVNFGNASVAYNEPLSVSLDSDTLNEVAFTTSLIAGGGFSETQFIANSIGAQKFQAVSDTIVRLNAGESIGFIPSAPRSWDAFANLLTSYRVTAVDSLWSGGWKDGTKGYIGVQLNDDGVLRYGWIALTMDTVQSRLVVHDGAYRTAPDEPIDAGQID
jgi:hypothetical protein